MISDVFFDAVLQIDDYLNYENIQSCYSDKATSKILKLRNEMELLALELGKPPDNSGRNDFS